MPVPMPRSRTARKLAHLAGRGPGVYSSARRAGASRRQGLEVVAASVGALAGAARREDGEPGRQNAMRHFAWQAYLAARMGQSVARRVAVEYEPGSPDAADSAVDERNNARAWQYAAAHGSQIRALGRRAALDHLMEVAAEEWAAGRLARRTTSPARTFRRRMLPKRDPDH